MSGRDKKLDWRSNFSDFLSVLIRCLSDGLNFNLFSKRTYTAPCRALSGIIFRDCTCKGDSPCKHARFGFGDRLCRAEAQAGPCVCSTLCAVSCLSGLVRVLLKQNMRLATRIRKHNCFALTHTNVFCTNTHTSLWNCAFVTGPSANVLCGANLLRLLVASTLTLIQRRRRESRVRVATQKTPLDAYKAHAERRQWLRPFPTTTKLSVATAMTDEQDRSRPPALRLIGGSGC